MTIEQILQHIRDVCGLKRECSWCDKKPCIHIEYLPVHLEHLIYAIVKNPNHKFLDKTHEVASLLQVLDIYNLEKSVEQNLTENTELRELIISLIK